MASSKVRKQKISKLKLNLQAILSLVLIIVGILLIAYSAKSFFVFQKPENQEKLSIHEEVKPQKVIIPKISKSLIISEGEYKDSRWTVAERGVSFLNSSKIPGQGGNAVIYGHNKKDILGSLTNLKEKDNIYVLMTNGKIVKYEVAETKQVKDTQVEILNDTKDNRLTVYTCAGFLDQARFVVIAKQVVVS